MSPPGRLNREDRGTQYKGEPMHIRPLVAADALVYRAAMLEAYERHPDAFASSATERAALPLSWWEARLGDNEPPAEIVLGAFQHELLAGVVGLSFESREKARHKATLFGMYVASPFRNRGLGRRLVEAALTLAKARPAVKLVQLTVTQGNAAARRTYEQCGFVEFGIEPLAVAVGTGFVARAHLWCPLDPTPPTPAAGEPGASRGVPPAAPATQYAARPATHADIATLVDLMAAFHAESRHPLDREQAARSFAALLAHPDRGAAWLVRDGGSVAGHVVLTLRHSMEHGGIEGQIDDLFIVPEHRRGGAATAALGAVIAQCRQRGVLALQVEVGPENAAGHALYSRFGLALRTGERQVRVGILAPHDDGAA
jgi:ribosomal protein S18 acetylase RimI-like enzyme